MPCSHVLSGLVLLLAVFSFGPVHVAGINGVPLIDPIIVADIEASAGFGNPSPVASLVHTLSPTASFSGSFTSTSPLTAADKAIDGNRNTEAQFIFDTAHQGSLQEATLSLDFHALTSVHKLGFEQSSNVDSFRIQLLGLRDTVKWSTTVYEGRSRYVFLFNGTDSDMNSTAPTAPGPINGVTSLRIVPLSIETGQPDLGVTEIEVLGWFFGNLDEGRDGVFIETDTGIVAFGADLGVRIEQTANAELRTPNPIWSQGVDVVAAIRDLHASIRDLHAATGLVPIVAPTRRWWNGFASWQPQETGLIPDRTLNFEKSSDVTSVKIDYSDVLSSNNGWCSWELLIDGAPCPSQPLSWTQHTGNNGNAFTAKTIVGYCDGLSAGVHAITVQVSGADCHTGVPEGNSHGYIGLIETVPAEPTLMIV